MNQYESVIQALEDPAAYPEPPGTIEHSQTHISHLFLTSSYVYKVKKPVDFGFLDFSTLEKRRYFCYEELRLNQRLSPEVYLDVLEVRRDSQERVAFGGPGTVVDYAVKMRRLPAERSLDHLLATNQVTEEMIRGLARQIGDFHRQAQTGPDIAAHGSPEAVAAVVEQNFEQTLRYHRRTLSPLKFQRLKAYSLNFLQNKEGLLEQRMREGWVRDGHGDLHSAQVFLTEKGAQIIDCIEFSEAFRQTDILADAAFMAMDLDQVGRHDLSLAFVDAWRERTGDASDEALLDFYKVYRAYVRGKVESFRLDDPHLSEEEKRAAAMRAQRYFNLAYSYIYVSGKPKLVLIAGMIGTGKSTIARNVACDGGLAMLSSDLIRKQLAGIPSTERQYTSFQGGLYSPEFSKRTYQELFRRAAQYLQEGRSVLLDATFSRQALREEAAAYALQRGAEFWVVECVAAEEHIRARLLRRERHDGSVSDGRWEIYEREKHTFEPVDEVPPDRHIIEDTSRNTIRECAASVLQRLGLDQA